MLCFLSTLSSLSPVAVTCIIVSPEPGHSGFKGAAMEISQTPYAAVIHFIAVQFVQTVIVVNKTQLNNFISVFD